MALTFHHSFMETWATGLHLGFWRQKKPQGSSDLTLRFPGGQARAEKGMVSPNHSAYITNYARCTSLTFYRD